MCDAAFDDFPCHHAIRGWHGCIAVLLPTSKMNVCISYFNDATWHTCKNVSYYLCCAPKWYKQKRFMVLAWLYMIVFLVRILLCERRAHDQWPFQVPTIHKSHVSAMSWGDIHPKYGSIWYSTSIILGSWNSDRHEVTCRNMHVKLCRQLVLCIKMIAKWYDQQKADMVASGKQRLLATAMREKHVERESVRLFEIHNLSMVVTRGLAAYMSNVNASVVHSKCCEARMRANFRH